MVSFVRFVFTILIVGMLVNLGVVLLANANSQHVQAVQYQRDSDRFAKLISQIDGHLRRADIVVEKERIDADLTVTECTLLIRQYQDISSNQDHALPVVRIAIPGNKLKVGGLFLDFKNDNGEYPMLNSAKIVLFGVFCGATEFAPSNPSVDDPRFTFLPRDRAPELLRLDPLRPQASYFEIKLWQNLWSQVPEPPRDAKFPWISQHLGHAMEPKDFGTATWFEPATIAVQLQHTYTAYVGPSGISLSEDAPGTTNLLKIMLDKGRELDQPEQQ